MDTTRHIKTRDVVKIIKVKDHAKLHNHFIRQKKVNTKEDESVSEEAIHNIQSSGMCVLEKSAFKAEKEIKILKSKRSLSKAIETHSIENWKKERYVEKIGEHRSPLQENKRSPIFLQMKKYVIDKKKSNEKTEKIKFQSFYNTYKLKNTNRIVEIIKKSVLKVDHLLSFGGTLILMICMSLFIGCFSALANDSYSTPAFVNVSDEVLAYKDTIEKYCKQYEIADYVSVVMAIMMQESGGKGNDPMQCSESGFNKKYAHSPNSITDPDYSIEVGVQTFADCLKQSKIKDPGDTNKLSLALQGYNYGNGYINWALSNFGEYTKANAKAFSDMMQAKLGTNGYGDPEYVDHVMRYVSITFRGGSNPNFNNLEAWVTKNPYAQAGLYGQCTWFAWGRFYELYGYDPGFSGDGSSCVKEMIAAHPDKFERSSSPKAGAVFSAIGHNHVGIVIAVNNNTITVQEGNLDGITNTFQDAKKDWQTKSYTLDQLRSIYGGVVFANPK